MKFLLYFVLLLLFFSEAHAQTKSIWKHFERPDVGVGLHLYSLATSDTVSSNDLDNRFNPTYLGAMVGLNLPVLPLADHLSVGINPNLGVAWPLSGLSDNISSISIEAPVYATLKYGTDATWDGARTVVGASVGVGYHFTFMVLGPDFGTVAYGLPSIFGELNFGKRRSPFGLIKFRYSLSLGSHTETFKFDGSEGDLVFTHHSFHLLFTPSY